MAIRPLILRTVIKLVQLVISPHVPFSSFNSQKVSSECYFFCVWERGLDRSCWKGSICIAKSTTEMDLLLNGTPKSSHLFLRFGIIYKCKFSISLSLLLQMHSRCFCENCIVYLPPRLKPSSRVSLLGWLCSCNFMRVEHTTVFPEKTIIFNNFHEVQK